MIVTVTLNAAIDRVLLVPNFLVSRRHRASDAVTLAGGRGVTIARSLKRLGQPAVATGLVGGVTGTAIIERLTKEGVLHDFVRITEPSRTSTAVIDPITGSHTEINEFGPRVSQDELDELLGKLEYHARAARCVVVAGSLPRALETDTYQRLVRRIHSFGLRAVLTGFGDTESLALALQAEPALVVTSQRDAEGLAGHEFGSDEDFILALDSFARQGARSSIITYDGGAFARMRDGRSVSYFHARHEPIEALARLGTTDVFVAGYLSAAHADKPASECLQYAVGAALANERSLGAGVFDPGEIPRLAQGVSVVTPAPVEA